MASVSLPIWAWFPLGLTLPSRTMRRALATRPSRSGPVVVDALRIHGDSVTPRLEVGVRGFGAVVYVRAVGLGDAWCGHGIPYRCGVASVAKSCRTRVCVSASGVNSLGWVPRVSPTAWCWRIDFGDVAGELTWGAFSGSPARAGALVRTAIVDAVGVAGGGGIG